MKKENENYTATCEIRRFYDNMQVMAAYWKEKANEMFDKYGETDDLSRNEKKRLAMVKSYAEKLDKVMTEIRCTSTVFPLEARKAFILIYDISALEKELMDIETKYVDVINDDTQCKVLVMDARSCISTVRLYMHFMTVAVPSKDNLMDKTIKAYNDAKNACGHLRACIDEYIHRKEKVERA